MKDYVTDDDPRITLPLWVLGSPTKSEDKDSPLGLIDGLVKATAENGETSPVLFSDEEFAKKFLETYPDKDSVVKIVTNAAHLDLLLQFLSERHGIKNVIIGKRDGEWSVATIAKVRFNLGMQD
jgi:hypothetical protein